MADWSDPVLSLREGDTDQIDFQVLDGDGNPQNVAGWQFVSSAKRSMDDADADAIWRKTTAGGGFTVRDADTGLMTIDVDPADTEGRRRQQFYVDWRAADSLGNIHTGDVKIARVSQNVSRVVP